MVQRSFILGSEWLYYKIYTGPKTSDDILANIMLPLVKTFYAENWIEKWFFIRYADPKQHLRIRFLISGHDSIPKIIDQIFRSFEPLLQQDLIWNLQLDIYHRELERYGENTMELSESLFAIDSLATASFLNLIEGDEGEQLRWLYGIRATDNLLSILGFELDRKLHLMGNLKNSFGQEFNLGRPLKKQLDDKFRGHRQTIENFMGFTKEENPEYAPILDILENVSVKLKPIADILLDIEEHGQLQVSRDNLLASYIHMLMNRLFKSKNRLNEMVCYDFLFRIYKSRVARNKQLK